MLLLNATIVTEWIVALATLIMAAIAMVQYFDNKKNAVFGRL